MKIKFPANCNTEASRLSFSYRLQQKLLDDQKIKSDQLGSGDMTRAEYDIYEKNVFLPKLQAITYSMGMAKSEARRGVDRDGNNTPWTPSIDRDFE